MTSFATGASTELTYLSEITYGTTPVIVAGNTQVVPYVSNSFNLNKTIYEDSSIQGNRQKRFFRHGNREVGGDISFAHAHETYDVFLESAFFNTFSANVLKLGQTLSSVTLQLGHNDISQYRTFTGVVVNTFALEVNLDGVVTSSFGLIGKDMVISPTSNDAAPTAAPNKQPFVHFDGSIKEGGVTTGIITSISLTLDNGLNSNYALGDQTIKNVTSSQLTVTGTLSAYFEDAVMLNKFVNETESAIEFVIGDGTNSHTYTLPKVKYNTASIDVSDGNTLPITLEFEALFDSVSETTMQITRTA